MPLPTEHDPAVVALWPPAFIAPYVRGLHDALAAMRPIVHSAQEWAADPDRYGDALMDAVLEYRLPRRDEQP